MRPSKLLFGLVAAWTLVSQFGQGADAADSTPLPPPYEGAYQPRGVDEIGLWRELDEEERELAASPMVIRDEKLTSYVKHVLCEAVGPARCESVRVYIMRDPNFNASMTPNGIMRVFSGLLLRARNEAELGAVLGHEFGHFEKRHTLNHFKSARTGTDLLAWAAVLASIAATPESQRSYFDLQHSVYGKLYRHDRNQEREADAVGVSYLNGSDLRPQAAAQIWQNLMGEMEASAQIRGLKKPDFKTIAFTASHPPVAERAENLTALALPGGATRPDHAEEYRAALAPWLPLFLEDQIRLNDFGASEYVINALAKGGGWTGDLWFARGELYRTRGNQRDLIHAAEFYAKAIELQPGMANAFRGLGLSLLKTGQKEAGQKALRQYLSFKPDASDMNMIRMMIPKEEPAQ